jgi:hypothetical protein
MRSWVRHSLVFAAALLLALPPGWCCVPLSLGKASASPLANRGCCQTQASSPGQPCPEHNQADGPVVPSTSCCCPAGSVLPPAPELPPVGWISAALPAIGGADLAPAASWPTWDVPSPFPSPPLQILHCVWLC